MSAPVIRVTSQLTSPIAELHLPGKEEECELDIKPGRDGEIIIETVALYHAEEWNIAHSTNGKLVVTARIVSNDATEDGKAVLIDPNTTKRTVIVTTPAADVKAYLNQSTK